MSRKIPFVVLEIILFFIWSCKNDTYIKTSAKLDWKTLKVSASAYNSVSYQTGEGDPNITAWGDTLIPGEKAIAVSEDLIYKGLKHNTPVRIDGLPGIYFVKDKMNGRWRNKIDIYFGTNIDSAKIWGRKRVSIHFLPSSKKKE